MIVQNRCSVIVMIAQITEKGKVSNSMTPTCNGSSMILQIKFAIKKFANQIYLIKLYKKETRIFVTATSRYRKRLKKYLK